jgi:hypothetical protein
MSRMRKGGERNPSIVEVPRNAEVVTEVFEHQMLLCQQGYNNREDTAKNGTEQRK